MKQGSSRFGNDFEAKCREFIAKYGFNIIGENEIIACSEKRKHKKNSHEIDIISVFSSHDRIPLPPTYSPSFEKFMTSCKGGLLLKQENVNEVIDQLYCLQRDSRFPDVKRAVIICQEVAHGVKDTKDVYIWDVKFMHLLAEKIKIARMVTSLRFYRNELRFEKEKISLIYNFYIGFNYFTQKESASINLYIFNENPKESIGKLQVQEIVEKIFIRPELAKLSKLPKFISIFSPSGVRTDVYRLKGKLDSTDKTLFFSKITDLSLATWVPYVEEDYY